MGGLSPALYRLIVPVRHAKNNTNIGIDRILAPAKISLIYAKLQQSVYLLTDVQQKLVKTKSDHHHCPISVHILTTSKTEANTEIPR
jgi:hypothetical protein